MKLKSYPAPHIRFQESNKTLMSSVILLLCVLMFLAYLFYGIRALAVCAASVAGAVVTDCLCVLLRGKKPNPRDLSAVVTGMIIALAMPATVSYLPAVSASVFAMAIVKHPFGGTGNNLFNPAAAGISFASICWPQQVFSYPMPIEMRTLTERSLGQLSSVLGNVSEHLGIRMLQNPSYILKMGGVPSYDPSEMLLGNFPGAMGATSILVLLTCLLFLCFRNIVRWQVPVGFLATCAAIAYFFPRIPVSGLLSLQYELMSGLLLFGAVFLLGDPVTRPKRGVAMLLYGIFTGAITMLFRYFGGFEESICFAVLLANAFVPIFDRYDEVIHGMIRRKQLGFNKDQTTQGV